MSPATQGKFERSVNLSCRILAYLGMGMLLVMMFLGSADVMGRYFFNTPITGTFEIFEILMPGLVLFALADTQLAGGHVTVGLLYPRLKPRTRVYIDFVTRLLLLVLFVLITWQGISTAIQYQQQNRLITNIQIPVYLPQLLAPIGTLAICPVLILQMVKRIGRMKGAD